MKIAVAYGGFSHEREVSLRTGAEVARALRERGFEVALADIDRESPDAILATGPDAVFLALHGRYGEDGQLASELKSRGIPFTGSAPQACAVAMDKIATRDVLAAHGVRVAQGAELGPEVREIGDLPAGLRLPLFLKPAKEGSSIGIVLVERPEDFAPALAQVRSFGDAVLAEERVLGEEWTVGIVDGQVLPPIKLEVPERFFDYQAKYKDARTVYKVDEPSPHRAEIQAAALAAARAVGTEALCRVDMILSADGPVILEINTTPGMTERSLLPKAARAAGMDFSALCERLILGALRDSSLERHETRGREQVVELRLAS